MKHARLSLHHGRERNNHGELRQLRGLEVDGAEVDPPTGSVHFRSEQENRQQEAGRSHEDGQRQAPVPLVGDPRREEEGNRPDPHPQQLALEEVEAVVGAGDRHRRRRRQRRCEPDHEQRCRGDHERRRRSTVRPGPGRLPPGGGSHLGDRRDLVADGSDRLLMLVCPP